MDILVEVLLTIILAWIAFLLVILTYFVLKIAGFAKVLAVMTKRVLTGFTLSLGFGAKK